MVRAVNQSLVRVASAILTEMNCEGMTAEERRCVFNAPSEEMLHGVVEGHGTKSHRWTKIPDVAFIFSHQNLRTDIPTVIFAIAWSESYEDLKDERQWLQHSGGNVRLVILVNMEEDWKSLNTRQKNASWKESVALLLEDFGNAKGKQLHAEDPIDTDDEMDDRSDAGMYHSIHERIQTADWLALSQQISSAGG